MDPCPGRVRAAPSAPGLCPEQGVVPSATRNGIPSSSSVLPPNPTALLERELKEKRGSDALRLLSPPKRWMERSFAVKTAGRKREDKSAPPDRQPGFGDSGTQLAAPGVWVAVQDSPDVWAGARCHNVPCHLSPYLPARFLPIIPVGRLAAGAGGARQILSAQPPELHPALLHAALGFHCSASQPREHPPFPAGIIPAMCLMLPAPLVLPGHLPVPMQAWPGSSVMLGREAFRKGR